MKKIKKLIFLLVILLATGYDCLAQVTYCASPRTSANPTTYTLNYTCRNVSGTTYEMKLEFANTVSSIANANIGANPGGVNVAATPVWSNANKTLTYTFTAASTPSLYVATIFVIISGTEVRWDLPTNANFAASCATLPAPVFGPFTVGPKVVGDADSVITPPTSDSSGAFTYTSSNANVATIVSGNQLRITGFTGTSTITAIQAADATHIGGNTTATLTVTSPNPAPTFGAFTVGPKLTTDPDFVITPPTSNSAGTFSYTSSNTAVATIVSGNQIHIVGAGTTTITATQAFTSSYTAGSTTASLVVSAVIPAAPTQPARNAVDVISIFSGAYTDVAGTDFNPNWGQASNYPNNMTTPSYGGDPVKQYQNPNTTYQGTRIGSDINVSLINKLHVDIYSPTLNSIRLFLIKTTGGTFETSQTITLTPGAWTSVNINVNSTTFPGLDLTQIREIKYDEFKVGTTTTTNQILIIDNLYFWRDPAAPIAPTLGAFTVPSKQVGDAPFTLTPPTSNSAGAFSYTSSNPAVATISGNTLTVVGLGTSTITATQAANGAYSAGSTTATFAVTPAAAPVPPARNTWDVVSAYSNSYTNTAGVNWTNGGGGSNTDVSIGGNTTRYISTYTFGQCNFTAVNVSAMTTVHIDVYSLDATLLWLWVGTNRKDISVTPNTWTSIDIPLSQYSAIGVDLTSVNNVRIENPQGASPLRNSYFDNIYFYRPASLQPPTQGAFTVPSPKAVGDAAFALTAPTSNSSGTWSYTSSNTAVATISGNTVTILAGGTTTITATQASDGTYGALSKTASLLVTPAAAPTPPARVTTNVISYYSGAYALEATPTWSANTTTTDVSLAGNNARYVNNFTFGQIAFAAKNVSTMTHIHVDIYSMDATLLWLWVGTNRKDINVGVNSWTSIDIPLSQYSAIGVNLTSVNVVKIENPLGAGTLRNMFVDNIYFYVAGTPPTITNFTVPSKVFGDADFALTQPTSNSPGAWTYTSSNPAVATISGSTVHLVAPGTSTITASQAASGSFEAGSITATLNVAVPPLNTPAPTPPARNAWDVISCYSGAYTNITPTPTWGGNATISDVSLSGDATKYLQNYVLAQMSFANTNVSAMSTLHFDIHSLDNGTVWVRLNNVQYIAITPVNTWASFDIPLASFAGAPLTAINNIQFVSPTGAVTPLKNIYVDNIYFYRAPTLEPPTITGFSIPAKTAGDPAFTITQPTSNSAGAFTYTSSAPSVATISGNTITIVGGGTATITATQAATATYAAGSVTAQFVVAYGPPTASPAPYPRTPDRYVSMYTGSPTLYPTDIKAVRANWTAATTMTEVPNGTNNCLKLENFGYLGLVHRPNPAVETYANFNVEGMTNLHLDIYLNAPLTANPATSRIFISLLWNGGEQLIEKTNLTAGWNSINIELSQYTNAILNQVAGIKLEQNTTTPTQIYLDNVFFSNDCYTYYGDIDGDGYGDDNTALDFCGIIPGAAIVGGDCDDNDPNVHPNATEVCFNGIDDDCDGFLSEGCAPVLVNILPSFCGSTLPKAKATITATNANYTGPGLSYLFRITNLSTNTTVDLPRAFRNFNLGMTDILAYNTQYSVMVAVVINGEEQPFSTPCLISTPGVPLTKLVHCGTTATSMSSSIACTSVSYALGYRYEVALASNPGVVKEFERLYNNFSMIMAGTAPNALPLTYDTDYIVRVKAKVLIDGEEVWGVYGDPCTVTTPPAPEAFMTACDEDGITPATMSTILYSNTVNYTTMYRFTLTSEELGYNQFVEHTFNNFRLSDFEALAPLTPGATYSVFVDVQLFGNYYSGKDCQLIVPGGNGDGNDEGGVIVKTQTDRAFNATAYPNPFANNFLIDVTTESNSPVSIKVYDMIGRLVDQQQIGVNSMESSAIGSQYPSGVYNVVITQDEVVKTLRVVKR